MNLIMRTAFHVNRFSAEVSDLMGPGVRGRRLPALPTGTPRSNCRLKDVENLHRKIGKADLFEDDFAVPPQENFARCILCAMVKSAD